MSRALVVSADSGVLPDGSAGGGTIVVSDGVITAVGDPGNVTAPAGADHVDAAGLLVAPGLLDIQINGGFGHDFTHEPEALWEVGERLTASGVTSFVPTVVTSGQHERDGLRAVLAQGPPGEYRGATPIGVHFEGPFISPDAAGAHDRSALRLPADAESDVAGWSAETGVAMATIAPELPGAADLMRELVARGVTVSAGHSAADHDQAVAGFDAGATYVTHLFNAMPPLGHRAPGLAGAALVDPRVTLGLIADGVHVHPAVVRLVAAAAGPGRLSLVTDATAALGMPVGRYQLGGRDVVLDRSSVRLAGDGRLAGSALSADQALRRFRSITGWGAAETLGTMTSVPARLLRLADRGALRVGGRGDFTLFTPDLDVVATFVGGLPVFGPWA